MEALFPTYAGRTAAARQRRGSPAAHPRLRGADSSSFRKSEGNLGLNKTAKLVGQLALALAFGLLVLQNPDEKGQRQCRKSRCHE